MDVSKYSAEYKYEAIKQVTERSYQANEVAESLGITRKFLNQWMLAAGVSAGARSGSNVVEKKD